MSINKDSKNSIEFLAKVLENYGTAQVLNSPSDEDRAEVLAAIKTIDLSPVMRDLTTLVVDAVANAIHTMALRPADYADMKDLPDSMLLQLSKVLSTKEGRQLFTDTFHDKLKSRG
jgi:hypothetical protein